MSRANAARGLAADMPARADANFVTHVTWALERTAGMVARVRPELGFAPFGEIMEYKPRSVAGAAQPAQTGTPP